MKAISLQTYEDTSSSHPVEKVAGAFAWAVNGMAVMAALVVLINLWLPHGDPDSGEGDGWRWRAVQAVGPERVQASTDGVRFGAEDRRLRDPFRPSDLEAKRKRKKRRWSPLQGIMMRNDRPYALIGGQVVGLGEWVLGMRVINIQQNRVVLANHRKVRVLYLY